MNRTLHHHRVERRKRAAQIAALVLALTTLVTLGIQLAATIVRLSMSDEPGQPFITELLTFRVDHPLQAQVYVIGLATVISIALLSLVVRLIKRRRKQETRYAPVAHRQTYQGKRRPRYQP